MAGGGDGGVAVGVSVPWRGGGGGIGARRQRRSVFGGGAVSSSRRLAALVVPRVSFDLIFVGFRSIFVYCKFLFFFFLIYIYIFFCCLRKRSQQETERCTRCHRRHRFECSVRRIRSRAIVARKRFSRIRRPHVGPSKDGRSGKARIPSVAAASLRIFGSLYYDGRSGGWWWWCVCVWGGGWWSEMYLGFWREKKCVTVISYDEWSFFSSSLRFKLGLFFLSIQKFAFRDRGPPLSLPS